jgi:hypothetical protein
MILIGFGVVVTTTPVLRTQAVYTLIAVTR